MFYGAHIKPGQNLTLSVEDGGDVLHLSQVCLVDPKDDARTYVQIGDGKSVYSVAVLQSGRIEQASVDVFIPTGKDIVVSTRGGKNDVDVVGYFEPADNEDDELNSDESLINNAAYGSRIEDLNEDSLDSDVDEDNDDDEIDEALSAAKKSKAGMLKNKRKAVKCEDDDDDEDMANGVQDDEEGDSDDAEKKASEGEVPEKKKQTEHLNRAQKKSGDKIQMEPKKQKIEGKGDSATTEAFHSELVKYLTANGRTSLGMLGQKVKKPAHIDKLGHYIKEHANAFKIDNGFVSLVK